MSIFRQFLVVSSFVCSSLGYAHTADQTNDYFRNFWYPIYQGQRLSYCTLDRQSCGLAIATDYCQKMGYKRADEALIDYNVNVTQYLFTQTKCKGLSCNGFTLIRCVGRFSRQPAAEYYYRLQRFEFPHLNDYRIDWCYEEGKGCGKHAAYSFCRRMGYLRATSFKAQKNISVTKSLGDQKLCFAKNCVGFSQIICYR